MSVLRITSAVVVVATLLAVSEARAGTMTFDALPSDPLLELYVEDGITVVSFDGFGLGGFGGHGLHLDDGASGFARVVSFSTSSSFTPVSFDVESRGYEYCPPDLPDPPCATPYDNVRVTAFRDGANVFEDVFSAGDPGVPSTYFFPDLAPIDRLSVRAVLPDFDTLGGYCNDAPCGHFDVDNVVLVPGPVTLPQLTLALVALRALRARPRPRDVEGSSSST